MNLIALSDLHGSLIKVKEPFDLMLIAGDVCPVYCHRREFQAEWLKDEFVEWVMSLPFKDEGSKVVMVAGNHDFVLESWTQKKIDEWVSLFNDRLIYLNNTEYVFKCNEKEYKIFGTPYCKVFGNWAFMREDLDYYYKHIPQGLDFLISHDAADINGLGMIAEGHHAGTNAGNKVLAKYLLESKPKYYFCGHIHSGNHELTDIGNGTKAANVAILDERYNISNFGLKLVI